MVRGMFALLFSAALPASARASDAGQVMLLGSYHLANNNRDIVNLPIEDVTTARRQRELEHMVDGLARWKPTRIAVEWSRADQTGLDHRYAAYLAGTLAPSANERDQIAFRLARKLGLRKIEAIDWNGSFPGPDSAYDFIGWAKRNGAQARFDRFVQDGQHDANRTAAAMWYRALNTPQERLKYHQAYFTIASFGAGEDNPGAAWVGGWYGRNLRIFTALRPLIAPKERVFVLYGSGHTYLLDAFLRESGAARMVDPRRYLPPR